MIRTFAFLLLIAGTLCAAPVPVARTKPETSPPVGVWISATLAEKPWSVFLDPSGGYFSYHAGKAYHGEWRWNPATRTLRVVECRWGELSPYVTFTAKLNRDLAGTTNSGLRVDLRGRK